MKAADADVIIDDIDSDKMIREIVHELLLKLESHKVKFEKFSPPECLCLISHTVIRFASVSIAGLLCVGKMNEGIDPLTNTLIDSFKSLLGVEIEFIIKNIEAIKKKYSC